MENESKFSGEHYIEKDEVIVNVHSTVSSLHYNNFLKGSAPNSFIPSNGTNECKNIECKNNEDNLVILNELPLKYKQTSDTNIQIESNCTSTAQKAFSPTIFENAVKVVKNLFSPVKAHGIFYRSAPSITINDVNSRKKTEEEYIFSEIVPDKVNQSINFDMKATETTLDGKERSYEVDMNQPVIKNYLYSTDSHNNTNDSYTTTVSRMDDSFQSTVTHFDDCIQVGNGELNEKIILVENVILDGLLNETLNVKNNSLNDTLIKNISTGSLESEHLNDTFETSVKCNTFCENIQDHILNFSQGNTFHSSFVNDDTEFNKNELKITRIEDVSHNFSFEPDKDANALEKIKIFTASSAKKRENLLFVDEDKDQETIVSTDVSSNTLNSKIVYNFDVSFLNIFTENSNSHHKKASDSQCNTNVDTFSGSLKDTEKVYEVSLFCSANNSPEINFLTYSEKDECDILLKKFQENKYPANFEKNLNTSTRITPSNEKCDGNKTSNIDEEQYSDKPIFLRNKSRTENIYIPNCSIKKIRGGSISDLNLHKYENEKICHFQNDSSHLDLKTNIGVKYCMGNSTNKDCSRKLNITNNNEKKSNVKWVNETQVHNNPSDKSDSPNIQPNPIAKKLCSAVLETTDCTPNQCNFQNDSIFYSSSTEMISEVNEPRTPLTSQKSYTVLQNLNPDFNRPVMLYGLSDTEIDKLNNPRLKNKKFMDLSVRRKTDNDAQDTIQIIFENNINVIDIYSDNSLCEIKEILPQQFIFDDRFAVDQTDSNKELRTDINNKTENKRVLNKGSNLKHFTNCIESFTETKTGLELDAEILSSSQSLKSEKIIKILNLSKNQENIDSPNISEHVKIIEKTLNDEVEKMNSRRKFNYVPGTFAVDQNCLETKVKNCPEANILLPKQTPKDIFLPGIWEENISIKKTKPLLEQSSNANFLESSNSEDNSFLFNQFEFKKLQPGITKMLMKCGVEDLFTKRDMNFHIIKKSLSNMQCSEANLECYSQKHEISMQKSFLLQSDSTLDTKKIIDNLIFDVEISALNDNFKELPKNKILNLNGVALSEVDVKKFNDTLASVCEIESSETLETLDKSQISDNNINLSQFIEKHFTRMDVEKICKVVDDISNLYLYENIPNSSLNLLNVDNFFNIKTSFENDQTVDETHNLMKDSENAFSSSCLDFLGSIEGKPSKRDYSRESLFIKFDPLVQTKNNSFVLTPEREENLLVISLSENSTSEDLPFTSPLKQDLNFSNIRASPVSQKNELKSNNVKLNKLPEVQNEIFRLKEFYLHREEVNKKKINAYEKEIMKLNATELLLESKIKEAENRGKLLVRKLNDQNESMNPLKKVVEEYFVYALMLAKQLESIKINNQKDIAALRKNRDCYIIHLQCTEQVFSDVHSKYEKCKKAVEMFKKNKDILKTNIDRLNEDIELCNQKIIDIEKNTARELNNIQNKINGIKFQYAQEIARLKAQIRKNDLKVQTLQETFSQKVKENKELAGICDELIEGKK